MAVGLFGGGGGAGLHSPIMGLTALPLVILLLCQIIAAIGAIVASMRSG